MKQTPLIPWPLLIAAAVAILAALYVSVTYASVFDHQWVKTKPASVKPWLYVTVTDTDFACRSFGAKSRAGDRINACAQWKPINCVIFLPENAPDWLIDHENKHCEGFDHAN